MYIKINFLFLILNLPRALLRMLSVKFYVQKIFLKSNGLNNLCQSILGVVQFITNGTHPTGLNNISMYHNIILGHIHKIHCINRVRANNVAQKMSRDNSIS